MPAETVVLASDHAGVELKQQLRAVIDLRIQFSFNDKGELLGWALKKNRR